MSGALKHEQFQQKHATATATNRQSTAHDRYKAQGPLIFKPFSENSAFKPIIPSPKPQIEPPPFSEANADRHETSVPRICGTSLKRHISNVETFSTAQLQNGNDLDGQQMLMGNNNRRKIHYADLAPLPTAATVATTAAWKNERNANDATLDGCANEKSGRQRLDMSKASEKFDLDAKIPTQYATLRFDEVNIDI